MLDYCNNSNLFKLKFGDGEVRYSKPKDTAKFMGLIHLISKVLKESPTDIIIQNLENVFIDDIGTVYLIV